jgi:hypothetical protein
MRRSRINKGIGTSHKVLFDKAAEFSNIVALDNKKPQDLPLGLTFFKVNGSLVDKKNIQVDKYVLAVQCFSPDALDITSARLSNDRHAVILTVAAPDKFVQDARLDIAHQIATCLDPNRALEKEVELNYVASMTAAYGKADKLLPVEDSDTDIAMKEILCILPPGVQGSNAYFNDGRINLNDRRQLQAFPFIHTEQFDSTDLINAGLTLYHTLAHGPEAINSSAQQASRAPASVAKDETSHRNNARANLIDESFGDTPLDGSNEGDHASGTAAFGATKDHWLKVEVDIPEGLSPEDYCLDVLNNVSSQRSKGYFVCFQIPVEGTNASYDILTNGRAESKSAKDAAFAHMTRGKRSPRRGK